jgi:hypothetical protein
MLVCISKVVTCTNTEEEQWKEVERRGCQMAHVKWEHVKKKVREKNKKKYHIFKEKYESLF